MLDRLRDSLVNKPVISSHIRAPGLSSDWLPCPLVKLWFQIIDISATLLFSECLWRYNSSLYESIKESKNLFGRQKWPMVLEVRSIMWQIIPGRILGGSGVLVVFLDLGASTFLKILVVYLWLAHFCVILSLNRNVPQGKSPWEGAS